MKKEKISIAKIRDSLRNQGVAGIKLQSCNSVSQLYATVVSSQERKASRSSEQDWATVSYVHTHSAYGSGGMPVWVAEDVEQVLDGLLDAKIISSRAIWFDRIGMLQHDNWTALATLHCLASPVICVLPTRTIEYSRYQIPDRWDPVTFDFFTRIEQLLQTCSTCGPKCPTEFDSRLLNVAAALRAWPMDEAIIAGSSRGAYISFASLDRLQYTIAWYQVLLQIALELFGYGNELLAKSIELYGSALLQPCSRCMAVARQLIHEEDGVINYHLLDDTLVALVMQANRFALPSASEREGMDVWSLEGLYKSPGERFNLRKNNSVRLREFSRRSISQNMAQQIAANICRGRPSQASCYRQGDKWLCSLILSNITSYLEVFEGDEEGFSKRHQSKVLQLLTSDSPYGDLCFRDSTMEMEPNRCIRSPDCDGNKSVCLFNHLSGIMKPSSVGEFLKDQFFSAEEVKEVLKACEKSFQAKVHKNGIALPCYEYENDVAREYGRSGCGACLTSRPEIGARLRRQVLIGWRAMEHSNSDDSTGEPHDRSKQDIVYSFVTVDAEGESHVRARGIFCRSNPFSCRICKAQYIRFEVEDCSNILEVHVSRLLPVATTFAMVSDEMSKCHNI